MCKAMEEKSIATKIEKDIAQFKERYLKSLGIDSSKSSTSKRRLALSRLQQQSSCHEDSDTDSDTTHVSNVPYPSRSLSSLSENVPESDENSRGFPRRENEFQEGFVGLPFSQVKEKGSKHSNDGRMERKRHSVSNRSPSPMSSSSLLSSSSSSSSSPSSRMRRSSYSSTSSSPSAYLQHINQNQTQELPSIYKLDRQKIKEEYIRSLGLSQRTSKSQKVFPDVKVKLTEFEKSGAAHGPIKPPQFVTSYAKRANTDEKIEHSKGTPLTKNLTSRTPRAEPKSFEPVSIICQRNADDKYGVDRNEESLLCESGINKGTSGERNEHVRTHFGANESVISVRLGDDDRTNEHEASECSFSDIKIDKRKEKLREGKETIYNTKRGEAIGNNISTSNGEWNEILPAVVSHLQQNSNQAAGTGSLSSESHGISSILDDNNTVTLPAKRRVLRRMQSFDQIYSFNRREPSPDKNCRGSQERCKEEDHNFSEKVERLGAFLESRDKLFRTHSLDSDRTTQDTFHEKTTPASNPFHFPGIGSLKTKVERFSSRDESTSVKKAYTDREKCLISEASRKSSSSMQLTKDDKRMNKKPPKLPLTKRERISAMVSRFETIREKGEPMLSRNESIDKREEEMMLLRQSSTVKKVSESFSARASSSTDLSSVSDEISLLADRDTGEEISTMVPEGTGNINLAGIESILLCQGKSKPDFLSQVFVDGVEVTPICVDGEKGECVKSLAGDERELFDLQVGVTDTNTSFSDIDHLQNTFPPCSKMLEKGSIEKEVSVGEGSLEQGILRCENVDDACDVGLFVNKQDMEDKPFGGVLSAGVGDDLEERKDVEAKVNGRSVDGDVFVMSRECEKGGSVCVGQVVFGGNDDDDDDGGGGVNEVNTTSVVVDVEDDRRVKMQTGEYEVKFSDGDVIKYIDVCDQSDRFGVSNDVDGCDVGKDGDVGAYVGHDSFCGDDVVNDVVTARMVHKSDCETDELTKNIMTYADGDEREKIQEVGGVANKNVIYNKKNDFSISETDGNDDEVKTTLGDKDNVDGDIYQDNSSTGSQDKFFNDLVLQTVDVNHEKCESVYLPCLSNTIPSVVPHGLGGGKSVLLPVLDRPLSSLAGDVIIFSHSDDDRDRNNTRQSDQCTRMSTNGSPCNDCDRQVKALGKEKDGELMEEEKRQQDSCIKFDIDSGSKRDVIVMKGTIINVSGGINPDTPAIIPGLNESNENTLVLGDAKNEKCDNLTLFGKTWDIDNYLSNRQTDELEPESVVESTEDLNHEINEGSRYLDNEPFKPKIVLEDYSNIVVLGPSSMPSEEKIQNPMTDDISPMLTVTSHQNKVLLYSEQIVTPMTPDCMNDMENDDKDNAKGGILARTGREETEYESVNPLMRGIYSMSLNKNITDEGEMLDSDETLVPPFDVRKDDVVEFQNSKYFVAEFPKDDASPDIKAFENSQRVQELVKDLCSSYDKMKHDFNLKTSQSDDVKENFKKHVTDGVKHIMIGSHDRHQAERTGRDKGVDNYLPSTCKNYQNIAFLPTSNQVCVGSCDSTVEITSDKTGQYDRSPVPRTPVDKRDVPSHESLIGLTTCSDDQASLIDVSLNALDLDQRGKKRNCEPLGRCFFSEECCEKDLDKHNVIGTDDISFQRVKKSLETTKWGNFSLEKENEETFDDDDACDDDNNEDKILGKLPCEFQNLEDAYSDVLHSCSEATYEKDSFIDLGVIECSNFEERFDGEKRDDYFKVDEDSTKDSGAFWASVTNQAQNEEIAPEQVSIVKVFNDKDVNDGESKRDADHDAWEYLKLQECKDHDLDCPVLKTPDEKNKVACFECEKNGSENAQVSNAKCVLDETGWWIESHKDYKSDSVTQSCDKTDLSLHETKAEEEIVYDHIEIVASLCPRQNSFVPTSRRDSGDAVESPLEDLVESLCSFILGDSPDRQEETVPVTESSAPVTQCESSYFEKVERQLVSDDSIPTDVIISRESDVDKGNWCNRLIDFVSDEKLESNGRDEDKILLSDVGYSNDDAPNSLRQNPNELVHEPLTYNSAEIVTFDEINALASREQSECPSEISESVESFHSGLCDSVDSFYSIEDDDLVHDDNFSSSDFFPCLGLDENTSQTKNFLPESASSIFSTLKNILCRSECLDDAEHIELKESKKDDVVYDDGAIQIDPHNETICNLNQQPNTESLDNTKQDQISIRQTDELADSESKFDEDSFVIVSRSSNLENSSGVVSAVSRKTSFDFSKEDNITAKKNVCNVKIPPQKVGASKKSPEIKFKLRLPNSKDLFKTKIDPALLAQIEENDTEGNVSTKDSKETHNVTKNTVVPPTTFVRADSQENFSSTPDMSALWQERPPQEENKVAGFVLDIRGKQTLETWRHLSSPNFDRNGNFYSVSASLVENMNFKDEINKDNLTNKEESTNCSFVSMDNSKRILTESNGNKNDPSSPMSSLNETLKKLDVTEDCGAENVGVQIVPRLTLLAENSLHTLFPKTSEFENTQPQTDLSVTCSDDDSLSEHDGNIFISPFDFTETVLAADHFRETYDLERIKQFDWSTRKDLDHFFISDDVISEGEMEDDSRSLIDTEIQDRGKSNQSCTAGISALSQHSQEKQGFKSPSLVRKGTYELKTFSVLVLEEKDLFGANDNTSQSGIEAGGFLIEQTSQKGDKSKYDERIEVSQSQKHQMKVEGKDEQRNRTEVIGQAEENEQRDEIKEGNELRDGERMRDAEHMSSAIECELLKNVESRPASHELDQGIMETDNGIYKENIPPECLLVKHSQESLSSSERVGEDEESEMETSNDPEVIEKEDAFPVLHGGLHYFTGIVGESDNDIEDLKFDVLDIKKDALISEGEMVTMVFDDQRVEGGEVLPVVDLQVQESVGIYEKVESIARVKDEDGVGSGNDAGDEGDTECVNDSINFNGVIDVGGTSEVSRCNIAMLFENDDVESDVAAANDTDNANTFDSDSGCADDRNDDNQALCDVKESNKDILGEETIGFKKEEEEEIETKKNAIDEKVGEDDEEKGLKGDEEKDKEKEWGKELTRGEDDKLEDEERPDQEENRKCEEMPERFEENPQETNALVDTVDDEFYMVQSNSSTSIFSIDSVDGYEFTPMSAEVERTEALYPSKWGQPVSYKRAEEYVGNIDICGEEDQEVVEILGEEVYDNIEDEQCHSFAYFDENSEIYDNVNDDDDGDDNNELWEEVVASIFDVRQPSSVLSEMVLYSIEEEEESDDEFCSVDEGDVGGDDDGDDDTLDGNEDVEAREEEVLPGRKKIVTWFDRSAEKQCIEFRVYDTVRRDYSPDYDSHVTRRVKNGHHTTRRFDENSVQSVTSSNNGAAVLDNASDDIDDDYKRRSLSMEQDSLDGFEEQEDYYIDARSDTSVSNTSERNDSEKRESSKTVTVDHPVSPTSSPETPSPLNPSTLSPPSPTLVSPSSSSSSISSPPSSDLRDAETLFESVEHSTSTPLDTSPHQHQQQEHQQTKEEEKEEEELLTDSSTSHPQQSQQQQPEEDEEEQLLKKPVTFCIDDTNDQEVTKLELNSLSTSPLLPILPQPSSPSSSPTNLVEENLESGDQSQRNTSLDNNDSCPKRVRLNLETVTETFDEEEEQDEESFSSNESLSDSSSFEGRIDNLASPISPLSPFSPNHHHQVTSFSFCEAFDDTNVSYNNTFMGTRVENNVVMNGAASDPAFFEDDFETASDQLKIDPTNHEMIEMAEGDNEVDVFLESPNSGLHRIGSENVFQQNSMECTKGEDPYKKLERSQSDASLLNRDMERLVEEREVHLTAAENSSGQNISECNRVYLDLSKAEVFEKVELGETGGAMMRTSSGRLLETIPQDEELKTGDLSYIYASHRSFSTESSSSLEDLNSYGKTKCKDSGTKYKNVGKNLSDGEKTNLASKSNLRSSFQIYSHSLKQKVRQLQMGSLPEQVNALKELNVLMEQAWSMPVYGKDLAYELCDILRTESALDIIVGNVASSNRELMKVSARLLEQSLTTYNRRQVSETGLETVVKMTHDAMGDCELAQTCTGILESLFKTSEDTCSRVIKLGGLDVITFWCRCNDRVTLKNCAIALSNLALYGGSENQQEMTKHKVPEWLFPLAFVEDDSVRYYALLAIGVLVSNKEIENAVISSGTLALVLPFVDSHDPAEFAQRDTSHRHGRSPGWLKRLIPVLSSKKEESQSLAAFHFVMEAGIKSEQDRKEVLYKIGAVEPLKWLASTPNRVASRLAGQALRIIGEEIPHKLSQQVPLWTIDDVVHWIAQVGFSAYTDVFQACQVDGDLLLRLSEDDLKESIDMPCAVTRKRFQRELTDLKMSADYTSCDPSMLGSWLRNVSEDMAQYTYQMLHAGLDRPLLNSVTNHHLLQDCGVTNGIHRMRILAKIEELKSNPPSPTTIQPDKIDSAKPSRNPKSSIDVFISYRRSNGSQLASLLKVHLQLRGFTVFIDIERLRAGKFDENLLESVRLAKNFIIVLTQNSLDRCVGDDIKKDWVHREIVAAMDAGLNIIPLMDNFRWPTPDSLPEDMRNLVYFNGIRWIHDYQDACVDKLESFIRGESSCHREPTPVSDTFDNNISSPCNNNRINNRSDILSNDGSLVSSSAPAPLTSNAPFPSASTRGSFQSASSPPYQRAQGLHKDPSVDIDSPPES